MFPQVEDIRNRRDLLSFPVLDKEDSVTITTGLVSQTGNAKSYPLFVFRKKTPEDSCTDPGKWIGAVNSISETSLVHASRNDIPHACACDTTPSRLANNNQHNHVAFRLPAFPVRAYTSGMTPRCRCQEFHYITIVVKNMIWTRGANRMKHGGWFCSITDRRSHDNKIQEKPVTTGFSEFLNYPHPYCIDYE